MQRLVLPRPTTGWSGMSSTNITLRNTGNPSGVTATTANAAEGISPSGFVPGEVLPDNLHGSGFQGAGHSQHRELDRDELGRVQSLSYCRV